MVSVLQPFSTGCAMSFNPEQHEEDERYARYWAQFAAPAPVSQQPLPTFQVPVLPSQPTWQDTYAIGSYAQPQFFQEPQTLYAGGSFCNPPDPQATPVIPSVSQVPPFQAPPAIAFSIPNPPHLSYTSEPAPQTSPQNRARTYSHDSYAPVTPSARQGGSPEASESGFSRCSSPGSNDMSQYGLRNAQGTWSCNYPGCTSRAVFTRGCDLRKHHKRHTKSIFCRYPGCSQATGGGFSSKKDLARHEAKHNPGVVCEWEGCDRIFSRVDNMRDHVKRIHLKAAKKAHAARASSSTSQPPS